MSNFKYYFKLLRPKHWIKNLIIFIPYILSANYKLIVIPKLILGFISFSLIASVGYIINDILDVDKDRQHHLKKYRPIAVGTIPPKKAFLLSIFLFILTLTISIYISLISFFIILIYFILNLYYTTTAKKIRFFDILLLSTFYIIRIFYGSTITSTILTGWFIVTITFIVISLSLNKRYMECKNSILENLPGRDYSINDTIFLQILMINFSLSSIIFLNMHAFFVLNITSFYFYFFLNMITSYILFLYFDDKNNNSDDPVERILKNKTLLINIVILIICYSVELLKNSQ
jgi:decaprenyl-phosphate phosphoribosyltransferase